jgi:hypothetical protein
MKVLLLSNQCMGEPIQGNPIMLRYRDALLAQSCINEVRMLRCKQPFSIIKDLRENACDVDVIHLHFGGMYAFLVWILLIGIKVPKVITFHGTDIHAKAVKTEKRRLTKLKIRLNQVASFLCIYLYDRCGFVSDEMLNYTPKYLSKQIKRKYFIEHLGVDYSLFSPTPTAEAQKRLGLSPNRYALFSDVSNTPIKRRDIAESIVNKLHGYKLLIMCGVRPNEVPSYLNACDFILLTSDEEGSPNIIREALSLNKRVFSVKVGDAAKQIDGLKNSCIISRDPSVAAETISHKLSEIYTDNTRINMQQKLDFTLCVSDIVTIYNQLNNPNNNNSHL